MPRSKVWVRGTEKVCMAKSIDLSTLAQDRNHTQRVHPTPTAAHPSPPPPTPRSPTTTLIASLIAATHTIGSTMVPQQECTRGAASPVEELHGARLSIIKESRVERAKRVTRSWWIQRCRTTCSLTSVSTLCRTTASEVKLSASTVTRPSCFRASGYTPLDSVTKGTTAGSRINCSTIWKLKNSFSKTKISWRTTSRSRGEPILVTSIWSSGRINSKSYRILRAKIWWCRPIPLALPSLAWHKTKFRLPRDQLLVQQEVCKLKWMDIFNQVLSLLWSQTMSWLAWPILEVYPPRTRAQDSILRFRPKICPINKTRTIFFSSQISQTLLNSQLIWTSYHTRNPRTNSCTLSKTSKITTKLGWAVRPWLRKMSICSRIKILVYFQTTTSSWWCLPLEPLELAGSSQQLQRHRVRVHNRIIRLVSNRSNSFLKALQVWFSSNNHISSSKICRHRTSKISKLGIRMLKILYKTQLCNLSNRFTYRLRLSMYQVTNNQILISHLWISKTIYNQRL